MKIHSMKGDLRLYSKETTSNTSKTGGLCVPPIGKNIKRTKLMLLTGIESDQRKIELTETYRP